MNLHRETVALCGAEFDRTVRYSREYIIEMYLDAVLQAVVLDKAYALVRLTTLQSFCFKVLKSFGLNPVETDGRFFVSILSALSGRPDDQVDYPFAPQFSDAVRKEINENDRTLNSQLVKEARAVLDQAYAKCDKVYNVITSASSYSMQHLVDKLSGLFSIAGKAFLIKGLTRPSVFVDSRFCHFGYEGRLLRGQKQTMTLPGQDMGVWKYINAPCRSAGLFLRSGKTWLEQVVKTDITSPVDVDAFLFCFGFLIASGAEFYNFVNKGPDGNEEINYCGIGVSLVGIRVSLPRGFIIAKTCTSPVHLVCLDTCAALGLIPGDKSFLKMRRELFDDKYVVASEGSFVLRSLPKINANARLYQIAYDAAWINLENAYGNE